MKCADTPGVPADADRWVGHAIGSVSLPVGVEIRLWTDADFPAVQSLSAAATWPTPNDRPAEALTAWRNSWPTLVATADGVVIGFLRALTDGEVSTYVAEILVAENHRGSGIGSTLLGVCQALAPRARIDLLSTEGSDRFYESEGFRTFTGFRRSYPEWDGRPRPNCPD